MSQFNVHKWNADRRKEALSEGPYPKRGVKWVDLDATQPRAYVLECDLSKALEYAEPLRNPKGTLIIKRPNGLQGVGYVLVAFKDGNNLNTYVNDLGNNIYDVTSTTPGSELGGEKGGEVVRQLNEGNPDKWSVIYTSPRGVESKYYYSSEGEARKNADNIKNYKEPGWKSIIVEPENK